MEDARLSRAQGRHLRASGRCQYPPHPSSLERRAARRLALRCLATRERARKQLRIPRAPARSHAHAAIRQSSEIWRLHCCRVHCQFPRSRRHPAPELEHRIQNAAFVPHHSRRLSAPHPFPSAPLHFWAAHLEFIYRLSEALGTPRPRGAYSPTSGVSTGRALMSARHCRPCHPPVYHRIPRTENEHSHSIDAHHTFCCYDQEGADLSDGRGQFRILLLALD
jgi:hypothetical protein